METKILLIDDDILAHYINKKLLQGRFPEEDIDSFDSALLALNYLEANADNKNVLHIIFLDINMPEINGWQFLEKLKENFSHLNFQIHMLTSSVDQEDQRRAKKFEYVHSYIFKPLNKSKLLPILDSIPENSYRVE